MYSQKFLMVFTKDNMILNYCKRLTLSHYENLLRGDYIIDDRGKHGTSGFKGEWLRFGSQEFPNWESVLDYLQV